MRLWVASVLLLIACELRAENRDGLTAYGAVGINYSFPGSVRIGWKSWEAGLLTPAMIGMNKNFPITSKTYSSFGLGLGADGSAIAPGLHAAVGFHYLLFWEIGVRAEIMANVFSNGTTYAHGLLGASYGF